MKDLHSKIDTMRCISPVSVADNTAQVGQIIDRQGFQSVEYVIATGALADADATFAAQLHEGDEADLSDASVVADSDLIGSKTLASFTHNDVNSTRRIGYKGNKRFTRLTITPSSNSSAALICAVTILGNAEIGPTPEPILSTGG